MPSGLDEAALARQIAGKIRAAAQRQIQEGSEPRVAFCCV